MQQDLIDSLYLLIQTWRSREVNPSLQYTHPDLAVRFEARRSGYLIAAQELEEVLRKQDRAA
jgi:hypothetical protein